MQAHLAQFSLGRILLHIACACRDQKYQWHWRGILREFVKVPKQALRPALATAMRPRSFSA